MVNKYGKGAVTQISKVVGAVYHVACQTFLWKEAPLPDLLSIVKAIELEKISLGDMENAKTVC